MASEAAVLGVPSAYINVLEAGTLKEQERLGILKSTKKLDESLSNIKKVLTQSSEKMQLTGKEDVTSYLLGLLEKSRSEY